VRSDAVSVATLQLWNRSTDFSGSFVRTSCHWKPPSCHTFRPPWPVTYKVGVKLVTLVVSKLFLATGFLQIPTLYSASLFIECEITTWLSCVSILKLHSIMAISSGPFLTGTSTSIRRYTVNYLCYVWIPKKPSSEPYGAIRQQQAIAKTTAHWSAFQITGVIVIFIILVFKV
jgi:hypothetical protein